MDTTEVKEAEVSKNTLEQTDKFDGVYESMLTTVDNPFDPFDQFDQWFLYDEEKGYHTCAYLGRVLQISDDMSDEEELLAMEEAIDEIIANDFLGIYKKVKQPAYELYESDESE
jgi:hypothetical protein